MSPFAIYCGLLFIASVYDIKSRQVPALLIFILMLAPLLALYGVGNLNFSPQIMWSVIFTSFWVFIGYSVFGFGGADGKILLGLSFILPIDVMAIFTGIALSIFIIYFIIFFRKTNEAPFIPAIAITATGLIFSTSM